MAYLIDFIVHIDVHLAELITNYWTWIYGILFAIIFIETGLVIMPFLPGDSLLFAAGSFAAIGSLNVWLVVGLLIVAAVLGDNVNFYIGRYFGHKLTNWKVRWRLLIKPDHIEKTQKFFEKHGDISIVLARFVPIVRTLAPFVAGIGKMNHIKFFIYNVVWWIVWITLLTFAWYFFGQNPWVQKHFEYVVFGIIFISILPMLIPFIHHKIKSWRGKGKNEEKENSTPVA